MARVTITFYSDIKEKIGKDRLFLKGNTMKEILEQIERLYPELLDDIKYGRIVCVINGRNIETLNKEETKLEDFDLVGISLKDGGLIDFFPPEGGG